MTASKSYNSILDKYLEISNYYHEEIQRHISEKNESKLSSLIDSLEHITLDDEKKAVVQINEQDARGQNIIPTKETLETLNKYRTDILTRLENPIQFIPRNIPMLKHWLGRSVEEIVSSFSTFTLAWDKLVDLSRLTLVADPKLLRIRDNIMIATIEFEYYINDLIEIEEGNKSNAQKTIIEKIKILQSEKITKFDSLFQSRLIEVRHILESRNNIIEKLSDSPSVSQLLKNATRYNDILSIIGLELGFTRWLESSDGPLHRKDLIKSLIYFSKILLSEKSWHKAEEFTTFALEVVKELNKKCDMPELEGTAMFLCNRYWARQKRGYDIVKDVTDWNVEKLHIRYKFLRFVLLGKFDDAQLQLRSLLPSPNDGNQGNLSFEEVDEWPILESFRETEQYDKLKQELRPK